MINILLVDQERLFSEGMKAYLSEQEAMHIIGITKKQEQVKRVLKSRDVHVVLINILLSSVDGLSLTVHIKTHYPDTKIIHYTSTASDELILKGIYRGADCVLLETVDPNHFVDSIHAVVAGEAFFSGEVAKVIAESILDFEFDDKIKLQKKLNKHNIFLSPRELDVLNLVKKGYQNKSIAQKLGLTEGTVKNYVSDLYSIFKKGSREALIDYIKQL